MRQNSCFRSILAFLIFATIVVAGAEPAQHPARRYLVRGTLTAFSPLSVTVQGHDRHQGDDTTRTLKVDSTSQVEEGLKVGDSVVADYNYTMDNNVYLLLTLKKATPKMRKQR